MPLVDCQSHIFSPEFAELLLGNEGAVRAERRDDALVVDFGSAQKLSIREADYEPAKKLADMDAAGVAYSILAPNMPGPDLLDPLLRERGARACNDYTASVCGDHPDRFRGLAVLPFGDINATMTEYSRAVRRLGLSGVALFSHVGGRMVDDPCWEPFYAAAADDGVPIVLHPTVPVWADAIKDHSMIPMMGFMVDHSFAMLRLILSGVLERHPALKIVQPHCGGVLPYLMPRIDEQTEVKRRGRERITRPPSSYYRDVYMDIVSPSPLTARFAHEYAGTDRLLFGSDHPWITIDSMVQVFDAMNLTETQRARIGYDNAAALFNLPTVTKETRSTVTA
ncbi:MAG: amidohydrolase family protein [Treponemataceae bacterium]